MYSISFDELYIRNLTSSSKGVNQRSIIVIIIQECETCCPKQYKMSFPAFPSVPCPSFSLPLTPCHSHFLRPLLLNVLLFSTRPLVSLPPYRYTPQTKGLAACASILTLTCYLRLDQGRISQFSPMMHDSYSSQSSPYPSLHPGPVFLHGGGGGKAFWDWSPRLFLEQII